MSVGHVFKKGIGVIKVDVTIVAVVVRSRAAAPTPSDDCVTVFLFKLVAAGRQGCVVGASGVGGGYDGCGGY